MNQELRPMDLGDIVDTSWKIYKEKFFTLIGLMAIYSLPITILSVVLGYNLDNDNIADINSIFAAIFMGLTMLLLTLILYPLTTGAIVKAAAEGFLNKDLNIKESLSLSYKKYFALLIPMVFSFLAIGIGTLVGLIGLIIGSPIAYIFLTTLFIFITQAVMIDDKGYFDAMGRSSKLVLTDFWRVLGIGIVLILISLIAGIIINLPGLLPYYVLGKNSITGQLFYNVFSFLSGILISPFTMTATTVLYFDLKIRKENFGKEHIADLSGNQDQVDNNLQD